MANLLTREYIDNRPVATDRGIGQTELAQVPMMARIVKESRIVDSRLSNFLVYTTAYA